jgi:Tfp pilus assembly protein PilN
MGLFWDLYQQSQISDHRERAGALEQRVVYLEKDLEQTQRLLSEVIARLERHVGADLNSDGRVG